LVVNVNNVKVVRFSTKRHKRRAGGVTFGGQCNVHAN